jgi:hypothetical protein
MVWSGVQKGNYMLIARATDNRGKTNYSTPVNIVVSNGLPVVNISQPTNGARFFEGTNLMLSAMGLTRTGFITLVDVL